MKYEHKSLEKKWQEAHKFYKKALKINCNYYQAMVCEAICYNYEKQTETSIKILKDAINLDPTNPSAYTIYGNILSSLGKFEEAINLYKKIVKHSTNKSQLELFIANAYMQMGEILKAMEHYRDAIKEDKDNKQALLLYLEIANEFILRKTKNE